MLISIITVVYNGENYIRKTMDSVLCQNFKDYEYIVIDGLSQDNTVNIAREYEASFEGRLKIYSEKDNGIYDAMNKGIKIAKGQWINFMNAGDAFSNSNVIEELTKKKAFEDSDLVYGDVLGSSTMGVRYLRAGDLRGLTKTMQFSHQSLFVKTILMKERMFSLKYKLAADYDFILSMYLSGHKFKYIPIPIATIMAGEGATHANFEKSKKEVYNIHVDKGLGALRSFYLYVYYIVRFYASSTLKRIIPVKLCRILLGIK